MVQESLDEPDLLAVALGECPDRAVELQLEALGELLSLPQPVQSAQRGEVAQHSRAVRRS